MGSSGSKKEEERKTRINIIKGENTEKDIEKEDDNIEEESEEDIDNNDNDNNNKSSIKREKNKIKKIMEIREKEEEAIHI